MNINDHEQKWHFGVGGHITVGRGYLLVSSSEDGELYAFGDITTDVSENKLLNNERIKLYQNYPNPVPNSGLTSISYYLPKMANVQLTVYDLQGIEIAVLENGNKSRGKHTLSFSLENISPGMYFYKLLVNDDQFLIKKMIVY